MAGLSISTYSTPRACKSVGATAVSGACSYSVTREASAGAAARKKPVSCTGLAPASVLSPAEVKIASSNSTRVLRGEGAYPGLKTITRSGAQKR